MKEQLQLKHLAPYLPYGLMIQRGERCLKMNTAQGSSVHWIGIGAVIKWFNSDMVSKPMPTLRPLSDLTKEITVNGEAFVPVDEIHNDFGGCMSFKWIANGDRVEFYDDEDIECARCVSVIDPDVMEVTEYGVMQKLFEWHFDVFGLIENGLAIDINLLNQTTK